MITAAVSAPAETRRSSRWTPLTVVGACVALAVLSLLLPVAMGFDPVARGPDEFAAIYKKDLPVWERLVKQSGATLD